MLFKKKHKKIIVKKDIIYEIKNGFILFTEFFVFMSI